ncbi:MAG: glycosyltransferase family 2 protein [Firmicutes bacterium]|nr:glycosyltransferase family 2 protein [Bacillota bacterium]
MKITVLIPAYNEEQNIKPTIDGVRNIPRYLPPELKWQIIVVDDGSTDNTADQAARCAVQTVRLEQNIGKGGALRYGLRQAKGDIILFLDADLRASANEAHKLVRPLLANEADVSIAKFKPAPQAGGFGFVKALAAAGVKYYTGRELTAVLSGQRAFKRQVLTTIGPLPDGFGLEVGMLIDILNQGYRVLEVETEMEHDVTGRNWSGFVHRGTQFLQIAKLLLTKSKE